MATNLQKLRLIYPDYKDNMIVTMYRRFVESRTGNSNAFYDANYNEQNSDNHYQYGLGYLNARLGRANTATGPFGAAGYTYGQQLQPFPAPPIPAAAAAAPAAAAPAAAAAAAVAGPAHPAPPRRRNLTAAERAAAAPPPPEDDEDVGHGRFYGARRYRPHPRNE